MNLLKHYIIEIHGTKECKKYPNMVEIDVTYDCYGFIERSKHITEKEQWKNDVERGYFMG